MKKIAKIEIDGVLFEVDLTDFGPGQSFFVPCLNLVYGKEVIRNQCSRVGRFRVSIESRIEKGRMGLRVWYKGRYNKKTERRHARS